MPPVAPLLDDRDYAELLGEALDRIAVANPEWTDFNRSDPGITLVELFAFLGESLLFRMDERRRRRRRLIFVISVAAGGAGLVLWRTACTSGTGAENGPDGSETRHP